ncbi:uncharacterized protein LOC119909784 isoform X4 [Micropterus salmoides]|uniref:uncharacterized protein LOC119909784 isoform X4 n=1 Tax=Micropterus salmoides TaxID=27706 RepID=UPI0018EDEE41|nr:uncharacterized protein LOC119909784 isoform X4 [Micropterus salmoides]
MPDVIALDFPITLCPLFMLSLRCHGFPSSSVDSHTCLLSAHPPAARLLVYYLMKRPAVVMEVTEVPERLNHLLYIGVDVAVFASVEVSSASYLRRTSMGGEWD